MYDVVYEAAVRLGMIAVIHVGNTGADFAGLARQRAAAPLKPKKEQEPCDVGLFSDQSSQLDLVHGNP